MAGRWAGRHKAQIIQGALIVGGIALTVATDGAATPLLAEELTGGLAEDGLAAAVENSGEDVLYRYVGSEEAEGAATNGYASSQNTAGTHFTDGETLNAEEAQAGTQSPQTPTHRLTVLRSDVESSIRPRFPRAIAGSPSGWNEWLTYPGYASHSSRGRFR